MKNKLNFMIAGLVVGAVVVLGNACSKSESSPSSDSQVNNAGASKWASFKKLKDPIFSGQYPLVGDPSIIKDGAIYRMFYTCFDVMRVPQGPEVCSATSNDGINWNYAPIGPNELKGRILSTGPGIWDTAHETSFILKKDNLYHLYFVGYKDKGGIYNSLPSMIGFAYSADGLNFTRVDGPILAGTSRSYDSDVITSPSITKLAIGTYVMVYAGFCADNCDNLQITYLMGATSSDGLSWTKNAKPIISSTDIPWKNEGLGEAEIILGPDGFLYLFMTVLQGKNPHQIGVARSPSLGGPWQVNPEPIITAGSGDSFDAAEVVAPSVLIEGNKVRLWFHGKNAAGNKLQIGYAESAWPLYNE